MLTLIVVMLCRVQAVEADKELIGALGADEVRVREEAMGRLKTMGAAARPVLEIAAQSSDSEIRLRAGNLLRRLDLEGELSLRLRLRIPGLVDRLFEQPDPAWTTAFLEAGDPQGIPLIEKEDLEPLAEKSLRGARDEGERKRLAYAMISLKLRRAVPEILRQYESRVFTHGDILLTFMARSYPKDIALDVIRFIEEYDGLPGWHGAHLLVVMGATDRVPSLRRLLKSPNSVARKNALTALGGLNAQEAVADIIELLRDEDWLVRCDAVVALGALKARVAIPDLVSLRKDSDERVRRQAVDILGQLSDKKGIPGVMGFLDDPSASVRVGAVLALRELSAKEALAKLRPLLRDPEEYVRHHTAEVIWTLEGEAGSRE